MSKISAWTMAELSIALIILIIFTAIGVSVVKNSTKQNKVFVYAAIRNLERANADMIQTKDMLTKAIDGVKNIKEKDETGAQTVGENDEYCVYINDIFAHKSSTGCKSIDNYDDFVSAANGSLKTTNGVEYFGLSNMFIKPDSVDADYSIKHIMVDINGGSSGPNKVWIDRYPLEIYAGAYAGMVQPADCSDNAKGYYINSVSGLQNYEKLRNPYCDSNKNNYGLDNQVLAYDIYAPISQETETKAKMIMSGLSPIEADCLAFGGNIGIHMREECHDHGFRTLKQCVSANTCANCNADGMNTCPIEYPSQEECMNAIPTLNPNSVDCFTLLHKPHIGMSLLLQGIVGDLVE